MTSSARRTAITLDRATLEAKALSYLERFDSSRTRLRRVLGDFVKRRAVALGLEPKPFLEIIDELLTRYEQSGLLDDRRYGMLIARRLGERGASRQAIQMNLRRRGLAESLLREITTALDGEGQSELVAARALVKKRRLGNYRPEEARRENLRRDLGILARAGFDFDTARRALAVEGADEEEQF